MSEGEDVPVIVGAGHLVINGGIFVFVVDSGQLGLSIVDTWCDFGHGKKCD